MGLSYVPQACTSPRMENGPKSHPREMWALVRTKHALALRSEQELIPTWRSIVLITYLATVVITQLYLG